MVGGIAEKGKLKVLLAKIFGGFSFLYLHFILSITVDIIYRECVDQCLTCKLGSGSDRFFGAFFFFTRPKSPFTDWVKETKCGPWTDHVTSVSAGTEAGPPFF